MSCAILFTECKRAGERLPLGFDLTKFCANYWEAGGIVEVGDVVRPTEKKGKKTGFEYRITQAGQFSDREPVWARTDAAIVVNGSVTMISQPISNDSLVKTITAVTWESVPAGLELNASAEIQNTDGKQKIATFMDDDPPDGKYKVIAHVEFDDTHDEDFIGEVTVD